MPNYAPSTRQAVADINRGLRVDRDAALVTAASVPIFTIAGGRIYLLDLIGEVTVQIAATATLIHIDTAPTVAAATALCIDSGDIQGHVIGQKYSLPAAAGSVLTISTGGAVLKANPVWVIPIGTLNLHASASPATGKIKWSLWYVPFDEGAYVEAA